MDKKGVKKRFDRSLKTLYDLPASTKTGEAANRSAIILTSGWIFKSEADFTQSSTRTTQGWSAHDLIFYIAFTLA
jgi:hypothetical protein